MDPATGLIVAGGIGAAADILGGSSARSQAKEQAQQQMDFQERMSSTAYQRATKDMQAAGLNPALMYGSGGPSSTPSGAQAPIENILGDASHEVVSSASDALRLKKDIEKTQSDIDLNQELAKTQNTVRGVQDAQASATRASARGLAADAVAKEQDAQIMINHPWISKFDAIADRIENFIPFLRSKK